MRKSASLWIAALLCASMGTVSGETATKEKSKAGATPSAAQIRKEMRDKINSGLVGVVLGTTSSDIDKPALFGNSDFFGSLEREGSLRVFQIEGKGSSRNVLELGFARGIDAGIIQSDVLDATRHKPPYPGVDKYLQYVAKLNDKDVHVLAGGDVNSIEDLRGKKVNFGLRDTDNDFTATRIFQRLGIEVEPTHSSQVSALDDLKQGKIAALVYVASKPADLFNFKPDDDAVPAAAAAAATTPKKLHFLSVPGESKDGYTSTEIGADDYPSLIESNQPVHTLAVGSILMVYNWSSGTDRFRKLAGFVKAVLDHTVGPTQTVNIAWAVPGWTRFAPADQWMKKHGLDGDETKHAAIGGDPKRAEHEDLFREFAQYYQQQAEHEDLFRQFAQYQQKEGIAGSSTPPAPRKETSAKPAKPTHAAKQEDQPHPKRKPQQSQELAMVHKTAEP